jgi:S-formylglutathione hydrolase FrmB
MKRLRIIAALVFVIFPLSSWAQKDEDRNTVPTTAPTGIYTVYDGKTLRKGDFYFPPKVSTEKLYSKLMDRAMPYRIVIPAPTSHDNRRFPVIYLLHGLTGHFDNWTDRTKLAKYASEMNVIIVTPEGEDGWYTDGVTNANDKYESYIVKELIPEIDKRFRTVADRKNRAIAGLSMGGYGALKFGIKYPEMFSLAGSFSGALGAAAFPSTGPNSGRMKSLNIIFGPMDSDTRKANDIFKMIREITPEKAKALPFLYIDCGTEDFLFQNNRDFIDLLVQKQVPHEFRQLPGGHTWPYWEKQVQEFLRIAERSFDAK